MSQNDFNIANQTFPVTRADLNSALGALASLSRGATAPTTPTANQYWVDSSPTDYDSLKIRNGSNTQWIEIGRLTTSGWSVTANAIRQLTSSGILVEDDTGNVILNLIPATETEAIEGVDELKVMTPLRVRQAIEGLVDPDALQPDGGGGNGGEATGEVDLTTTTLSSSTPEPSDVVASPNSVNVTPDGNFVYIFNATDERGIHPLSTPYDTSTIGALAGFDDEFGGGEISYLFGLTWVENGSRFLTLNPSALDLRTYSITGSEPYNMIPGRNQDSFVDIGSDTRSLAVSPDGLVGAVGKYNTTEDTLNMLSLSFGTANEASSATIVGVLDYTQSILDNIGFTPTALFPFASVYSLNGNKFYIMVAALSSVDGWKHYLFSYNLTTPFDVLSVEADTGGLPVAFQFSDLSALGGIGDEFGGLNGSLVFDGGTLNAYVYPYNVNPRILRFTIT